MTALPGTASGSHARLQAGAQLGEYILGQPLWPTRIADAYRANGPKGASTVYVIKPTISANTDVRDAIIAGTRAAAGLAEHKHIVHTLAAGLTGDILWIATDDLDGQLVRDMLIKKKQGGTSGYGVRGTGNLMGGIAAALSENMHGALHTESVIVSRTGRVKIVDLALGPGTLAAMKAGLIPMPNSIAPEVQQTGKPSSAGDVYAVGALFYEALTGVPLERGGPRPSELVQGASPKLDELVGKACHSNPEKRYGHIDVLAEAMSEALGKSITPEVSQAGIKLPPAPGASGATFGAATPAAGAAPSAAGSDPGAGSSLAMSIGDIESGNAVVDRALSAALADTTEKFLISKGRLDYGPFSLADVVAQIEKGDIVAGNIIMDKDSGSRGDVAEHPLLGPIVETARQKRDDQRRAQAEIKVQSADKKKGAALYGMITMAIVVVGLGAWLGYNKFVKADEGKKKAATVAKLEGAELHVTVSLPKVPPAKKHTGGHGGGGGGGGGGKYSDNMTLDLSDDSDETETLGMDKVYAVYSHYGSQLGGCIASNGGGSATIGIIIDGPTGRVKGVKVNDKDSGGLHSCIWRVMQQMQFPKINGPRTRAEFDIGV